MRQLNYNGTINSLFKNASLDGVLTIPNSDVSYFSTVIGPARHDGRIICKQVDGGFQYRLVN